MHKSQFVCLSERDPQGVLIDVSTKSFIETDFPMTQICATAFRPLQLAHSRAKVSHDNVSVEIGNYFTAAIRPSLKQHWALVGFSWSNASDIFCLFEGVNVFVLRVSPLIGCGTLQAASFNHRPLQGAGVTAAGCVSVDTWVGRLCR